MRQRKQGKQSFVRNTGFGFSHEHNTASVLESELERDYFLWRRYELGLGTFLQMQPPSIEYTNAKGNQTRYTADSEMIEDGHCYIDEVKYQKDAEEPENVIKFAVLTQRFAQEGKIFRVMTEHDIRVGHRIANIRQLYTSKLHPAPHSEFKHLTHGIRFKHLYLQEAIALCKKKDVPLFIIKRAIAHQLFRTDITQPWPQLALTWS